MSTRAVDAPDMRVAMMQAFLRDVTGEFDVSEMHVGRLRPGVLHVIQPGEAPLVVDVDRLQTGEDP